MSGVAYQLQHIGGNIVFLLGRNTFTLEIVPTIFYNFFSSLAATLTLEG